MRQILICLESAPDQLNRQLDFYMNFQQPLQALNQTEFNVNIDYFVLVP